MCDSPSARPGSSSPPTSTLAHGDQSRGILPTCVMHDLYEAMALEKRSGKRWVEGRGACPPRHTSACVLRNSCEYSPLRWLAFPRQFTCSCHSLHGEQFPQVRGQLRDFDWHPDKGMAGRRVRHSYKSRTDETVRESAASVTLGVTPPGWAEQPCKKKSRNSNKQARQDTAWVGPAEVVDAEGTST
eukprot:scaffold19298_cov16-Tisochrysis_lutea.AAC.1